MGHLEYVNHVCKHYELHGKPNASIFDGAIINPMVVGTTTVQKSALVYRWCKQHPTCRATCYAKMCYITHQKNYDQSLCARHSSWLSSGTRRV
jgi:hypothetical protein